MKQILIDCCKNCPLKSEQGSNFCTHVETEGMELKNLNIIDPDCPLKDV